MPDRLSSLDASFLYMDSPTSAMHVGGVAVFEPPPAGLDADAMVALICERVAQVPRYRQRVRAVPGRLANPVWVDAEDFDVTYHVRRSALPRPGSPEQLRELIARVQSRRLDPRRPLWELYLVEGLAGGRFAVVTKTHHALVDGRSAVDVAQLILDTGPEPHRVTLPPAAAAPEPGAAELVAAAVAELVRRPSALADAALNATRDLRATVSAVLAAAGGLLSAARVAARPAPASPLNVRVGEQRRFATAVSELDDFKRVRKVHGGTVNDVVLATVTGALRRFLLSRGEVVGPSSTLRAMVPLSVRTGNEATPLGNQISAYFVDLPVGETDPVRRLHQVSAAMSAHKESGQSVGAEALVALAGFAPPTLHALGAQLVVGQTRRLFNVAVTNVPGPQFPLYANGARMVECYPVVPLAKDQAVAIGLTSYDGHMFTGLYADRDAMADLDVLAALLPEALAELVETAR